MGEHPFPWHGVSPPGARGAGAAAAPLAPLAGFRWRTRILPAGRSGKPPYGRTALPPSRSPGPTRLALYFSLTLA
jgi:hypothetical protein